MNARAIVLTGPMGAGKSSVGKRAAKRLRLPFIDTDSVVAREHGAIPEIFATHGEAHFRRLEADVVAQAVESGGVIALGGGAVVTESTRELLRNVPTVFLSVSREVVPSRVRGKGRPLLAGDDDPVERWASILQERLPLYLEVSDIEIDTSTGPLAGVVDKLVTWAQGEGEEA